MADIHVEKLEQFEKLVKESGAAVVKFTATWCGPCRKINPDWKRLASHYKPKCAFIVIDIDEADQSIMKSVNAVPTFHFYKNGVVVDQMSGANVTILESKLKSITAEEEKPANVEKEEKVEEEKPEEAEKEEKDVEEKPVEVKEKEDEDETTTEKNDSKDEAQKTNPSDFELHIMELEEEEK